MDINEEFRIDRIVFLSKLSELCKYDTKIPCDAFEVGRQLHFDDEKTGRIVNYLLEKNSSGNHRMTFLLIQVILGLSRIF